MTQLTIQVTGHFGTDLCGQLVDPAGEVVYSHISSSAGWLERDLTSSFGRKTELETRYPDGYTVIWDPSAL